jgi:hypothetical protein
MSSRHVFIAVTLFWVTMNVLLWREEFGSGRQGVAEVPVTTVVDRVLNAPDASLLTLRQHGRILGQLRWTPSILETAAPTNAPDSELPEGMVRTPLGNKVDLDLNLFGDDPSSRWRVMGHLDLDTNQTWTSFQIRLLQRPSTWEINATAGSDAIQLTFDDGHSRTEQHFSTKDLARPSTFLGPLAALIPRNLLPTPGALNPKQVAGGFRWTARNDWLRIGNQRVRVYRIRARWLDRFEANAYFSRAGEILRITLPDGISLGNEALPGIGGELRETTASRGPESNRSQP